MNKQNKNRRTGRHEKEHSTHPLMLLPRSEALDDLFLSLFVVGIIKDPYHHVRLPCVNERVSVCRLYETIVQAQGLRYVKIVSESVYWHQVDKRLHDSPEQW